MEVKDEFDIDVTCISKVSNFIVGKDYTITIKKPSETKNLPKGCLIVKNHFRVDTIDEFLEYFTF